MFYGSLHTTRPGLPGGFNLDGYRAVLSLDNAQLLFETFRIAATNTTISLAFATVLAWLVARTDVPGRRALEVLITFPIFIPPILTSTVWGMLANPSVGILNVAWQTLTGDADPLLDIYSYAGVIWLMVQMSTAFLFMLLVDVFRAMDPSLEDASRLAGARPYQTFFRITLGMMLPALSSCFLLSLIRGMEAFEPALLYGSQAGIRMLATQIYLSVTQEENPSYQYPTALSFTMIVLMFLLVLVQWRILKGRRFQTVTGKGYTPRTVVLGRWRWLAFLPCAFFVVCAVILPVLQLISGSFFEYFGIYRWDMLTLEHYREVLTNPSIRRSFINTLVLAVGGAVSTMALGSVVAYATMRTRVRGRRLLEFLAWLPWMMPGMVMAVGFLWVFALLPPGIPLYGTIGAMLIADVALCMPVSVRVMSSAYAQISGDLEECSRVAGASWLQTQWHITLALVWPSLSVGWLLVFFGILREMSAAILLYSAGSETFSITLYRLWNDGRIEQVSVIGLFLLLLVVLMRWAHHRFLNRGVRPV
ncbi:ABC transporter permease [Telmatospirillum siberiense]|uniref:ABC transporter permease n=1 Tax=Telmatospirillum siberiense TaxID=382514 RepID=A0A2N3PQ39_9PROT|nr:ABC transporter permease [Telmatospirillum siberiense]